MSSRDELNVQIRRLTELLKEEDLGAVQRASLEYRLEDAQARLERLTLSEGAPAPRRAIAEILFEGDVVQGQQRLDASFAGEQLQTFQQIVGFVLVDGTDRTLKAKGPRPMREKAKLGISHMARGSVGFVLEEWAPPADQRQLDFTEPSTELNRAVTTVLGLFGRLHNGRTFSSAVSEMSPRLLEATRKFVERMRIDGAGIKIHSDNAHLHLGKDQVCALDRRLTEIKVDYNDYWVDGILTGLKTAQRTFGLLIKADVDGADPTQVQGKIGPGIDPHVFASFLRKRVDSDEWLRWLLLSTVSTRKGKTQERLDLLAVEAAGRMIPDHQDEGE